MNSDTSQPHARRPRYKGTHPRTYGEKYKEHNLERYTSDIERVITRGQTPAGTHRPICVSEILTVLKPKPGCICLDATLGFGGHSRELLPRLLPGGHLYGIDVDPVELPKTEKRLRDLGFGAEVLTTRKLNFAGIGHLLCEVPNGFDCILADLGVSSMQLDDPQRGFSYKLDGPLDLRLNPHRGASAADLLHSIDVPTLADLLCDNADEPHATLIAKAICASADKLTSTKALADVVRRALENTTLSVKEREGEIKKSQQRTFMALRIAVNDEFGVLDRFLDLLPWSMKLGGRVAILTFHSGEDRRVKKAFKSGERSGIYSGVARRPIRPSAEEQQSNPRSSCAKLRWAVRSDLPLHQNATEG